MAPSSPRSKAALFQKLKVFAVLLGAAKHRPLAGAGPLQPPGSPSSTLCCRLPVRRSATAARWKGSARASRAQTRAHASLPHSRAPTSRSAPAHRLPAAPRTEEAGINPLKRLGGRGSCPGRSCRGFEPYRFGDAGVRSAWETLMRSKHRFFRGRDLSTPLRAGSGGGWGSLRPVIYLAHLVVQEGFSRGRYRICR